MNDSMNPIPDNAVLIIADVQNGFLNENTDYLPGAINDFITDYGKWFDEIIMLKLENGDTANYPVERNGKAGGARTLKNQYQSRLVPPLNRRHSTKLSHSSSTDIHEIIEHINDRIVYLCGMETDVSILPMASVMINAGLEVNVIYDLTATTIGTGVQIAMKPVLSHLLGESHVIESITDTRTDRNDTDNDNIDVMIPETDAA